MPAQSSMGLQFGHVLKPVFHFASGITAVEKDDGVTEAMQFSVSLLFCVYGCVCMSYVLLFHISQTASQTRKYLCVCVGGGGVALGSCAPCWSRQTAELPVTISNLCFLLFLISSMSHLLQQNTHTPKGLRLSYSISLVPLISNPPKNTFCAPLSPSLQCLTSCHAI